MGGSGLSGMGANLVLYFLRSSSLACSSSCSLSRHVLSSSCSSCSRFSCWASIFSAHHWSQVSNALLLLKSQMFLSKAAAIGNITPIAQEHEGMSCLVGDSRRQVLGRW